MEQYFQKNPTSKREERIIPYTFKQEKFMFASDNGVFSKEKVDFGTHFMLETFIGQEEKKELELLDAGCGIGTVGVVLAKFFPQSNVLLFDINERAVELAKKNLVLNHVKNAQVIASDCFSQVHAQFDAILLNPPVRSGKQNVFRFYEEAYQHLKHAGKLYVVIQKKQGAPSSKDYLSQLFRQCDVIEKKAGYHILRCTKT